MLTHQMRLRLHQYRISRKELRLFRSESKPSPSLKSKLRKSENRTRIAECKLDRLKSRFDRMHDDLFESQDKLNAAERRCEQLKGTIKAIEQERDRKEQEAVMWRSQLFERMSKLDRKDQEFDSLADELERMKGEVEQAQAIHQATHQELQRRDRQKLDFESQIEEFERSKLQAQDERLELLDALTGAESAIASLQRANDLYQREVDGLKSIGASLTEKLSDLSESRDHFKEKYTSAQDELLLVKSHNEHLTEELERLRDELYETKGKLLTAQLSTDAGTIRKLSLKKSNSSEKYAEFPHRESRVMKPEGRSLLSRATKKMTGWFRLSNSKETLPLSKK